MQLPEMLEQVLNGTVTAALWFAIIWGGNRIRNKTAEHKLRRTFAQIAVTQRTGPGPDDKAFGVALKNDTEYEITVRDVTLLTNKPNESFLLFFSDKGYEYMFQEKPFKDPRKMTHHQRRDPTPLLPLLEQSADLGPFMSGTWFTDSGVFDEHPELIPVKCHVAIQYKSLLGNPKVLVVESNVRSSAFLEESFMKHKGKKSNHIRTGGPERHQ